MSALTYQGARCLLFAIPGKGYVLIEQASKFASKFYPSLQELQRAVELKAVQWKR